MVTIKDGSYPELKLLFRRIEAKSHTGTTLQAASQACAEEIYDYYRDSLVLVRVYATRAYAKIPQHIQQFAREIADAQGVASMLQPESIILTLLGTAGVQADWNNCLRSRGHLGIPLVTASFVENLPMVAALMKDMGLGLDWLDRQDNSIVVRELGRLARAFFVPDARTAVDAQGRKVVPASDFVAAYGVRTVFGLGGGFLDGTFLAMIFFTREIIEKPKVEAFLPIINLFKLGTLSTVLEHMIFE
jgi:hypothetical protein